MQTPSDLNPPPRFDRRKIAYFVGLLLGILGGAFGGSEWQTAREAMCNASLESAYQQLDDRQAFVCTCENGQPVPRALP